MTSIGGEHQNLKLVLWIIKWQLNYWQEVVQKRIIMQVILILLNKAIIFFS